MSDNPHALPDAGSVLVSDFDGTLAQPDFYQMVRDQLTPPGTPDFWQGYREGTLTHFDVLNGFYGAADGGEPAYRGVMLQMELPEGLAGLLRNLADGGWGVVIVSAGCRWYIDQLLRRAEVDIPVFANPGEIQRGKLVMQHDRDSRFFDENVGISKAGVVRELMDSGRRVAYAGDGFMDLEAARLVDPERRFARSDLAEACDQEGLSYVPFDHWSEIAERLLSDGRAGGAEPRP